MHLLPGRLRVLLIFVEQLFGPVRAVLLHRNDVELLGLVLFNSAIVHSVLNNLVLLFFFLLVPPVVLVLNVVFQLISLLCVHAFLVYGLHALGEMVRRRKSTLIVLTMLYL